MCIGFSTNSDGRTMVVSTEDLWGSELLKSSLSVQCLELLAFRAFEATVGWIRSRIRWRSLFPNWCTAVCLHPRLQDKDRIQSQREGRRRIQATSFKPNDCFTVVRCGLHQLMFTWRTLTPLAPWTCAWFIGQETVAVWTVCQPRVSLQLLTYLKRVEPGWVCSL